MRLAKPVFSRGGGRLLEGGRLFQNLSPRGGANSKRGAYWKLGAYSSIYGIYELNDSYLNCFIAQLVEHCTGIAEVTGSNPVEALIFSGFFLPIA